MEGSHIEVARPRQQGAGPSEAGMPPKPRCAAIIAANPASRAAGLTAAAAAMAEEGVASVRVGNPLGSPLTLHRILIQLGLDGQDPNGEDDDAQLARLLTNQGAQGRIVLVVEQAETLDRAALLSLQRLAGAPGSVAVLFVGGLAFWALLDGAGLAPLRQALAGHRMQPAAAPRAAVTPLVMPPVPPAARAAPNPLAGPAGLSTAAPARSNRRWWIAGAAGLVATLVSGAAAVLVPGGLFYYATPHRQATALPEAAAAKPTPFIPEFARPVPTPTAPSELPAAPPPQVAPPKSASPPSSSAAHAEILQSYQRSRLAQPWGVPGRGANAPSDAQRDAMSKQSPAWQPSGTPPLAAPSSRGSRVVVHYRDGSATGGAEADRLAAAAAPLAEKVQTRAVADTPSARVIRFFHAEDAARARQLAGALRGSGPGWDVKDFSSFRPSPSAGTIEVWTPTH